MKLSNTKVALVSLGVFTGMLGLGFAADPLYDTFCKVTGFGGTTRIATAAPDRMVEQEVMVRFDANVADTPLTFHPLQTTQTLKLGQHGLAFYEVSNPTDQEIRVIASYNVTPHYAGPYFNKLECFCFEERVVAPGETKKLPIVYFVSADMLEDRVAKSLETITLSYTFFDSSSYSGEKKAAQKGAANSANAG